MTCRTYYPREKTIRSAMVLIPSAEVPRQVLEFKMEFRRETASDERKLTFSRQTLSSTLNLVCWPKKWMDPVEEVRWSPKHNLVMWPPETRKSEREEVHEYPRNNSIVLWIEPPRFLWTGSMEKFPSRGLFILERGAPQILIQQLFCDFQFRESSTSKKQEEFLLTENSQFYEWNLVKSTHGIYTTSYEVSTWNFLISLSQPRFSPFIVSYSIWLTSPSLL